MSLGLYVYRIKRASEKMIADGNFFPMYDEEHDAYSNFGFPEWAKKYEREYVLDFYDWDEYRERTGVDINEYELTCMENGIMTITKDGEEKDINVNEVNIVKKPIKITGIQQVSYYSDGYNDDFYDAIENGSVGKFLWTLKELKEVMDKYCLEDQDDYSFRAKFKENVIDKFVEGAMCVYLSW